MKPTTTPWITFALGVIAAPAWACGQEYRELKVHLVQANNSSPYAFVRAKFLPGELADPWAVRFVDDKSVEIPYFQRRPTGGPSEMVPIRREKDWIEWQAAPGDYDLQRGQK